MYIVSVNDMVATVSNYRTACKQVKEFANDVATSRRVMADFNIQRKIYRSSKTAMNRVAALLREANNIDSAVFNFPKNATSCNGKTHSIRWSINNA